VTTWVSIVTEVYKCVPMWVPMETIVDYA